MPDKAIVPRIVVLGGAVIDLVFYAHALPEWGQAIQSSSFRRYCGGKGLNQAIAASKLGVDVSLISAIGNDEFGQTIIETLDMYRIDRTYVKAVEGRYTDVTGVIVNDQGEAAFIGWKNTM